ncbi:MAG: hypothetical protein COU08_00965 [Candidatus Harrisonbacteria bacterium CG10_big_fil_rev_8_21_14_0_10_42_17]|uniref:Uncharacterized protein n=1 Tax=Candidatus Harrisonbacteria bacterium CG10_big_fil_rev_8_21_14_0_10_42_17 TaxID=1974584 RepID=A0A2M6WIX6_9BACT|nr:MAG: hypothetical protein COU08_00965 [Candidatus Harrisonbacteria bacterium CG10_big_fil_rev_8_21_14_0_10_42_17]
MLFLSRHKRIYFFFSFLLFVSFFALFFLFPFFASTSNAQTASPEIILTWKTDGYVPAEYRGRILPSSDVLISAAVELLQDGSFIDLSGASISWLVNRRVLSSGVGLQTFSFTPEPFTSSSRFNVTARIQYPHGVVREQTVVIPNMTPETIIDTPYRDGAFNAETLFMRALSFYYPFNRFGQIQYSWTIDARGQKEEIHDGALTLTIPRVDPGERISVSLISLIQSNPPSYSKDSLYLRYQP